MLAANLQDKSDKLKLYLKEKTPEPLHLPKLKRGQHSPDLFDANSQRVARLVAVGYASGYIIKKLGISSAYISKIKNSEEFKQHYEILKEKADSETVQAMVKITKAAVKAAEISAKIIENVWAKMQNEDEDKKYLDYLPSRQELDIIKDTLNRAGVTGKLEANPEKHIHFHNMKPEQLDKLNSDYDNARTAANNMNSNGKKEIILEIQKTEVGVMNAEV